MVVDQGQGPGLSFRRISVAMRSGIAQRWVLLVKCLGRAPVVTLQGGSNDELISGRRIFNQHREESRRSDCRSLGFRACLVGRDWDGPPS